MNRTAILGAALALLAALSGPIMGQQIYRTTDAQGNVVFTDTPPPGGGAEQVQLQHTNTAEPTPPPKPIAVEPAAVEDQATPVPVVKIVSPANEETIPMGGGNFSVTARVEPPLQKGQAMRLLLDGQPTGKLQPSGFWDLTAVERGAHDLTVEVVGADGVIVSQSQPVRVYVMRPSTLNPPAN